MHAEKQDFQQHFAKLASQLGSHHIDSLLAVCRLVELPAGRTLFRDRMPVEALYLLLEGELAISIESKQQSIKLGIAKPGEWLGEVSVLSGSMLASSTVTTLSRIRALKIHYIDFENLIRGNDHIANALLSNLIDLLAERLRTSTAAISRLQEQ